MSHVDLSIDGRIATITLDRPDKLNAITEEMNEALVAAFGAIKPRRDIHVVIVRGNGKAFSAGHDMNELSARQRSTSSDIFDYQRHGTEALRDWFGILWNLPQPVIAEVQGYCINYALELAMNADIVIAADDAQFASRPLGGTRAYLHLWPWLIGLRQMKEVAFTRPFISGKAAAEKGMINRSVPPSELSKTVRELAEQIAAVPLEFLAFEKQAINRCWEEMGLLQGMKASIDLAAMAHATDVSGQVRNVMGQEGWRQGLQYLESVTKSRPTGAKS